MLVLIKKSFSETKKTSRKKTSEEFIDEKDRKKKKENSEAKRLISTGLSVGFLGKKAATELIKGSYRGVINSSPYSHENEERVKKALLDKAKNQGIEVIPEKGFRNAAYTGLKSGKWVKEGLEKIAGESLDDEGIFEHIGKDRIIYDPNHKTLSSSAVLSHELGHAQYGGEVKRSKDFIARSAHNLSPISNLASGKVGIIGSAINGYRSGIKSEEAKEKGEKEGTWNKVRSVAVPVALMSPLLISEASASVKGLKMLKEAGADKDMLSDSKKTLGAAFGTYAAKSLIPVAAGVAGRLVGKGVAKLKRNRRNKKEEKEGKENE